MLLSNKTEEMRNAFQKEQIEIERKANNGKSFIADSDTLVNDEGSLGFLTNALEFLDPIIYKPLYKFFWQISMPIIYGGGVKELASFFKVNYSMLGNENIGSGNNNVLKTVKVQLNKFSTRVMPYTVLVEVGQLDQLKADAIGLSILDLYNEGAGLQYNRFLDQTFFYGFNANGITDSYGLINNPNVTKTVEATTKWDAMTATELFTKLNTIVKNIIVNCEYDDKLVPDRMLVPMDLFTKLAMPMAIVGENGATATTGVSLYDYLKANLAKGLAGYDKTLDILPCRYCASAGDNSTGRIVIYRYSEDCVRGVISMELTRGATVYVPTRMAYQTTFMAFVGEPQFIYKAPIQYYDNKA